jgi:hypothetical protein
MFNFFMDMGNYEDRKVARFDADWGMVSTARVSDGRQPYETAVCHKQYNDDKIVIVEAYDSVDEAKKGHERWVKTMTSKRLPKELVDCCNAEVGQFAEALGAPTTFKRKEL